MEFTKFYVLSLPVWKQGDDLARHLRDEDTVDEAFEAMARRYQDAALYCRRVAAVAREVPGIKVEADTHMIGVYSPASPGMETLEKEGILQEDEAPGGTYAD